MKTNIEKIKSLLKISLFLLFTLICFSPVYAQTGPNYTVLQPLPGIGDNATNQTTLSTYLPAAFNLTVGIAVALAFIMLTYGGVLYATSDALSGKSQGKEYIENALWGLLLVIGSYMILYTINPKILDFGLVFNQSNIQATTPPVYAPKPCCTYRTSANGTQILNGYTLTPAQQQEDVRLRAVLLGTDGVPGITVNRGSACTLGQEIGCTNIVGLPSTVISGLIALKSACQGKLIQGQTCAIVVTGGTEGGHASHGPNRAVFDLSPTSTLNTYLATINPEARNPKGKTANSGATTVNLPGLGKAVYEPAGENGRSTGAHWHIHP